MVYTFHNEAHLVASDKWYAAGDSKLNRFLPQRQRDKVIMGRETLVIRGRDTL